MRVEDWDDLRFVLAIGRAGSLAGAARALEVNQTTVSRRLDALEARTGLRLFDRRRGGVTATAVGEAMLETAARLEDELLDLERKVTGQDLALTGEVRLTLPELLGAAWIEHLNEFALSHPQLTLSLDADHHVRNLSRREADVALRYTAKPPDHLVGRRLGAVPVAVYGAAAMAGRPLDALPWLGWDPRGWPEGTTERARRRLAPTAEYAFYVSEYMVLMAALNAGAGVSAVPCVYADRQPGLVRLSDPEDHPQRMWLLTHPDLQHSPRIRALMEFIYARVDADPEAMLGPQ